jgi:hypothetical protein
LENPEKSNHKLTNMSDRSKCSSNNSDLLADKFITIRDIANRGFIPYSSIHEVDTGSVVASSCQFCNNTSVVANMLYRVECYFDVGKTKQTFAICESCLNDYHKRVEELTGLSTEPKLVVADKFDQGKYEIFNACQYIFAKQQSYNEGRTNAECNDRFDFIEVVKSCYETSNMVRYYIGDPENITLDNRKLWPLRYRIYSELNM